MTTLPDAEQAFFWAAMAQLEPAARPIFTQRVMATLSACSHCEPGPGDCDRAVREALKGLWMPPALEELAPTRWDRASPTFDRASKRAW